jgi:peptidoglycan/xylan/chitin deacetylase (PgdA/CDA1 family)
LKRRFKIAISCFYYVFCRPIFLIANLLGHRAGRPLIILYYHDIPDSARAGFARQMDMLIKRATVVSADWRGAATKRLVCAITFDDALNSVMTNALPELAKRQIPCTIFVPAGIMGRKPDWVMETECNPAETVASPEEIKSLPGPLVTIGAHTVSHPFLSRIPRDAARAEIEMSRAMLSATTGHPISLMSFPYGDYDDGVAAMCREAGYDLVFGIEPQRIDPLACDFIRGRVAVDPTDGPLTFFLKMTGSYSWMPFVSELKKALIGAPSFARPSTPRPGHSSAAVQPTKRVHNVRSGVS